MKRSIISELTKSLGEEVLIKGWLHRVRKLSKITFLVIRDRSGMIQCVVENSQLDCVNLKAETVLEIIGKVVSSSNKLSSVELQVEAVNIISEVREDLPLEVNSPSPEENLETLLNYRTLSLRRPDIRDVFTLQAIIAQCFAEFLIKKDFTQIFSPKIVAEGAEGGTAIFEVKYFENKAFLAQSPQFYKQIMVGVFERVFEISQVYRAEEHNTSRHLNEYVSLDLEMGFIEDENEIMELERELLSYIIERLSNEKELLERLKVELPKVPKHIPQMKLSQAVEILNREYGKSLEGDLDPEGEKLICSYAKEHLNSEFLFLTHYPQSKRPMYTMPCGETETHSFDLLFRGLEITTGGQRIHSYEMLCESMLKKGLNPNNYGSYMDIFKFGMPPHGGLAIGLERLTAKLLKLNNVREASLFPRDRKRITP